ncbi:MAG TPA: VWA domain-containing protein [Longimicrobiales bacterium]|nr:VWA domain-containing protein [Longimicrobiales bacterium]
MNTSILLDHEPVADGGYLVHALLRLEGEAPPAGDRVPLNLSLVLDRSGSMAGAPLRAAIASACLLVRRLRPEDLVSVVAYSAEVEVVAPPATGEEQDHLCGRIAGIRAGGSTNLSGGWLKARDLVAAHARKGAVNRVLILTDGLANVGITEPHKLVGLCRSAARSGIGTTTLGFGPDFDEDLLRAMADAGGGGTYYIERVDQAPGIFDQEIEGLLSICAQNLQVQVRPGAHAQAVRVLHSYPSRSEGNVLSVELGDLYAREPRSLLLEVLLGPDVGPGCVADVAQLIVSGHVVTEDGGVERRWIELPITLSPEHGGRADPVVRREVLLLSAARAREQAARAQECGDYDAGGEYLRRAVRELAASEYQDDVVREEVQDLRAMESSFRRRALRKSDIKRLKQSAYDASRSRRPSTSRDWWQESEPRTGESGEPRGRRPE